MKTLRHTIALLPLLTLAAACSDSDPAAIPAPVEGDFHVMMSVLPSGTTPTGSGSDAGTDAERAFDDDHIYFATYKLPVSGQSYNGEYMTFIKDGATLNNKNQTGFETSTVDATYFTPTWGPSVAARLPKDDYSGGFVVGFFSVPANTAPANFTVRGKNLGADANFTLKWPAAISSGATEIAAWAPNKDNGNHIPMAGLVKVTSQEMTKYNPDVYTGVSPFQLPNVRPMRAMAKVVIEDPEGLIAKAEMKTAVAGMLFPNALQFVDNTIGQIPPREQAERKYVKQVLTSPNGSVIKDGKTVNTYVFYSYEQSFRTPSYTNDLSADDEGRKLITLTSDPAKLKDAAGNALHTTVSIAPYTSDGKIDTSSTSLMTDNNGSWQGLMRNRVYTYTISSPSQMTLTVSGVHVSDFEYEKINTEL